MTEVDGMPCAEHGPDCADGLDFADADMTYAELDLLIPLGSRFPDWRILTQDVLWIGPDGHGIPLVEMPLSEIDLLLRGIRANVTQWHGQAAQEELYDVTNLLIWAYEEVGAFLI